jgi:hypothetical protein
MVEVHMTRHTIVTLSAILTGIVVPGVVFAVFWRVHKGARSFYFDAADFYYYEKSKSRELPVSAGSSTFEPMLAHYVGVTKLLIAVAAASVSFGANANNAESVHFAKIVLSWSILYGVLFCTFLLYRYDEYTQDVRCYTKAWYSTVETFGFSSLTCFILGYFAWAFQL